MGFNGVLVTEIFRSIQGESSLAGLPFAFVRLTGCNLRCVYCDSAYAFHGGKRMSTEEVLAAVSQFGTKHVLITGGEPLIQRNTPALIRALQEQNYKVSVETHGELSIAPIVHHCRVILDIKTPSSGMQRGGYRINLPQLKTTDEVKFVIASENDYEWAREFLRTTPIPTHEILFSPAMANVLAPGQYPGVEPRWLAERILEDRLPVRLQLQLHKLLWGPETRGV